MKKVIFTLSMLLLFTVYAISQVTIEDFEGTVIPWSGDGTYATVDNPTTDGLNTSAKCGSYTKSGAHAYSLLLGTLDSPLDLSTNNEFHMMINAPAATKVIFKLEGGGNSLEVTKVIASTNVWRDYVFDMSAASGFTGLDKIVIFFDPGVETSDDTYLFDNIVAYPQGPCAGTIPVDGMIDDFECQRNVTYGVGWDVLTPIANPQSGGINTSTMVGQYNDPEGEPWIALVADFGGPMDLSVRSILKVKIWSSLSVPMLFKLEGGVSPAKEVWQDITTTDEWVEYVIDFSDQANANHEKLAIFFNGGVDAGADDVYYIDDITFEEVPPAPALEDFDPQKMGWGPAGGNAAEHGSLAVISNPDMSGIINIAVIYRNYLVCLRYG